ncbi:MAG: hypothetical protein CBE24_06325 [bacterium TMED264]|nr:MAG: hypothetical protein CBE24_06325 [bacterium TMED264]|tara:strand:- start:380 stop:586 length:207 start_codon:yes stop_codon:yes gene_type:complete
MIDFSLSSEQEMLIKMTRKFAKEELATSTIMSVNNSLVCQLLLDWDNNEQKINSLNHLPKDKNLEPIV